MKNKKDTVIKSASLGYLETFDPMGHEWTQNPAKAFPMTLEDAENRVRVLREAGFDDAGTLPLALIPVVPGIGEMNLAGIARVIRSNWKPVYFGAKPYLDAMGTLDGINDKFGADPGKEIVLYFLSNAGTWKGPVAKTVKAELKNRLKKAGVRF